LKAQVRVIGIDDSPFEFRKSKQTWLVGVVFRGNLWMEGVVIKRIRVDGMDATDVVMEMIMNTKFSSQIRVAFLDGITFGGFNLVDIEGVYRETGVPVVSIVERMPNIESMKRSMARLPGFERRLEVLLKSDAPVRMRLRGTNKSLYVQSAGIEHDELVRVLELCKKAGTIPEALREARMIASALPKIVD